MIKYLIMLSFVCVNITVYGAPGKKAGPVFNKFAPPMIMTSFAEERPKVVPTGEFSSFPMPAASTAGKKTQTCLAARFSSSNTGFIWRPSKLSSSAIGVADLTGAALSSDGSLAVISERIGGENKPNSSRFLLFNIPEKRLAGGFEIPELLLTDLQFADTAPGFILAIRHKSHHFKTIDGIVKIDLKTKKISDAADSTDGAVSSFTILGDKVVFTVHDSSDLYIADLNDLSGSITNIPTKLRSPRVCSTSGLLAAFDRSGLELFKKRNGSYASTGKIFKAPEDFDSPLKAMIIDPVLPAICMIGASEKPLWYFYGNKFRKLKNLCAGFFTFDSNSKFFYVGLASKAKIAMFRMPEGIEEARTITPNRLRPSNRNGSYALLSTPALKESLIQIDNRGNVFLLGQRKKSWRKNTIHIADKTGFR
ncbi:MAG: hypothetical protein IKA87_09520 [Lentisphaeria bacterium]|nr:hypothetical protein [Lentisphaeria bacterium]